MTTSHGTLSEGTLGLLQLTGTSYEVVYDRLQFRYHVHLVKRVGSLPYRIVQLVDENVTPEQFDDLVRMMLGRLLERIKEEDRHGL